MRREERTVDTLILALFVDVVKVPQHLDRANVGARIVDDALAPVLYEIFQ